jgi:SHS2 domain-containing protein
MRGETAVPHRWLEDEAIADAAFEAWAPTPEGLLVDAGEAVLEAMSGDAARVRRAIRRDVTLEDQPDLLLVRLLEALLWHKDAEQLLLHVGPVTLARRPAADGGRWEAAAELWGERIDPSRHDGVDVKAVTLHRLFLGKGDDGSWRARVVLDV